MTEAGAADARMAAVIEEGRDIFFRFDSEVRSQRFHPFVAGDYERVLHGLRALYEPGLSFLEWGSATGVITILADIIGFDACGIELDERLVASARELAAKHGSNARFATGSFLPAGYTYRAPDGDTRLGTIGYGPSGYLELQRPLEDFDVVYGYPWTGEDALMHDLMKRYGARDAKLVLHGVDALQVFQRGRPLPSP